MASQTFDFYQKYTNILLLNCIDAENGSCKIWTGAIQRKRNYMLGMLNVAYPNGKRTKMNVARLSKMLQLKTIDIDRNLDASHLCHNALCVNADHIIFEPHDLNNHRKVCVASQKCTTHELHGTTYPNCMLHLKLWFVIFLILKFKSPRGDNCTFHYARIIYSNTSFLHCSKKWKWDKSPPSYPPRHWNKHACLITWGKTFTAGFTSVYILLYIEGGVTLVVYKCIFTCVRKLGQSNHMNQLK